MMQTKIVLPWQEAIWESLLQRKNQDRLPHALLFSGSDGIGKKELAQHFANYVLCGSSQQNGACGHCHACCLQKAKTHPDFMSVEPEEGAQLIKIDQIREVVSFVNGTTMMSGYRVVLVNPASAMNINAANALLKTLEEPAPNTLLILICHHTLRLPATISSRCQKIQFPKPGRDISLAWLCSEFSECNVDELSFGLDMAGGAPLLARDYLKNDTVELRRHLYNGLIQLSVHQADPLQFAEKWEDKDVKMILNLLLVWLRDLLQFKLTESQTKLINSDYYSEICTLMGKFTQENLLQYCDLIQKMYAQLLNSLNVNRQLLLKEIFIRWVKLC